MKEEVIITHSGQKYLDDFLKVENSICLNCNENQNNICTSITSEFYNMLINEINMIFCINQDKKIKNDWDEYLEDKQGGLFNE